MCPVQCDVYQSMNIGHAQTGLANSIQWSGSG